MPSADLTFLELRSRFVYSTTDWSSRLPVRAWERVTPTIGGHRISAAGTPASYIVRRDHILLVPLRFFETEWADVQALIAWGQSGELLTWYPDALDAGTSFSVYMHSPAAGEDITPSRDGTYPGLLDITIGLRSLADTPWTLDYFYG